jgi:hypothetical protein
LPGARSKPRKRKKKPLSEENLLELGRNHFAKDFPNPKRQGCPPRSALRLLAEDPRRANNAALNHVSSCSPCYRDYSHFLQVRKKTLRSKSTKNE